MNDRLIMENYLLVLKSTVEVYVHGTLESSNGDVRELLKKNLNNTLSSQADTYDLMANNNWYQVENLDSSKINNTLNKLQSSD